MLVDMTLRQLVRLRWAVRCALALGIAASVAANVLHAQQNPIAQTIAAWPPLALLLTLELISRVPVHRRVLAVVRVFATVAIAGIAAWVSYSHMLGVAQRYGETGAAPYLLPLSVDGLVVVASVSLVELAGRIQAVADKAAARHAEAVIPAAAPTTSVQATPALEGEITEAFQPGPQEKLLRRMAAVGSLVDPARQPAQIASDAGVTVETLQRWADSAASRARRPRGRKQAAAERDLAATG